MLSTAFCVSGRSSRAGHSLPPRGICWKFYRKGEVKNEEKRVSIIINFAGAVYGWRSVKRVCLYVLAVTIALCLMACTQHPPEPAPTPEPSPTPEPPLCAGTALGTGTILGVETLSSPAFEEGDYFDNALFVGDSIMEGIRQYVAAQRQSRNVLGTAQFLTTTVGIGVMDLVGDRNWGRLYSYKGVQKPLEDILEEIAPRRVFLLLGLNDLSFYDPVAEDIASRYSLLISNLQAVCPETEFIVVTNPPKVDSEWLPDYTENRNLDNELIEEFVAALKQMCHEQRIPYVDIYESLKDENGALPYSFSRDGFAHLSYEGAAAVVEALNAFAEEEISRKPKVVYYTGR